MKQFSIMYRQLGIFLCIDNFELRWPIVIEMENKYPQRPMSTRFNARGFLYAYEYGNEDRTVVFGREARK